MTITLPEPIAHSVTLPPDAAYKVRQAIGLNSKSSLRIAFIAGPGDVVGTFDFWSQGAHDPRTPVIAYSSMFYTLVDGLEAEALVLIEQDKQPTEPDLRFRFVHIPRQRNRRGIGYRLDERAYTNKVLRHLREYCPDVILIGTDAPDALLAGLPRTKRVILTAHNTYWPMDHRGTSLKVHLKLWMKKRALRRVDLAVNTSDECAAQVATLGGPSDTQSFTEVPQVLPDFYPESPLQALAARRLLYVGRIEANKGVFDLLGAFDAVAVDHPDLTLEFAGSGSCDAPLQAAIAASPHADRITFHGQLIAQAIHDRMDAVDLLICPTRSTFNEGLGLVVVEAAVHGVPTLLSSVVPAKGLLPGACAEFPVDNIVALTGTLRRIINTPTEYGALCAGLAKRRRQFRDRSKSWGSMLYCALSA